MAAVGGSYLTLVDHINRLDPNGAVATIVESLSKECPLIQDAVMMESNLPDSHKYTSRQSLPAVSRRRLNRGTENTKSTTSQVIEPITMLESRSIIDIEEAALNGNTAAFRASEDLAFMEAMAEQAESVLLYDSHATNPDEATGALPRLDSTTGDAGKQIVLWGAGGSNTNASLLFMGWGEGKVFGVYPKGSMGGLKALPMKDPIYVPDPADATKQFLAYVTNWSWKIGLCVKDKRYIAAVRNIDMSTIGEGTPAAPVNDVIRAAVKAVHKIKNPQACKGVWYAPRDLHTYLHLQALSSVSHSTLALENVAGSPVVKLLGFPVRIADQMTTTEAAIS